MVKIGARIVAGGGAVRLRIQHARIGGVAGVAQVHLAKARIGEAMAPGPGGHDAVEHVDPATYRLQQIVRGADAHKIARLLAGQMGLHRLDHVEHDILRLAHRQPADGVAGKVHGGQGLGALHPQPMHRPALHDAEDRPAIAPGEGLLGALGPAQGQAHGPLGLRVRTGQLHAFVELHLDVRAQQALDLHGPLGGQHMARAVDMGLEGDAILIELAQLGQRHHLKPAGIRQDRMRPVHELVQPAQLRDALGAGPQHEMVGIAQHDVRAQRPHLFGIHGLHGRRRAHGHEGGGADLAAGHGDHARARRAIRPLEGEAKLFGHGMIHWKGAVRAS